MIAIIFALIAAIGWGTADVFGGLVARKMNGYSASVWSYVICLIIASFYIPFAWHDLSLITPYIGFLLVILTIIGALPLMSLYEAIKLGNASLVGTIAGANGGLVVILSVLFLGERINLYQVLSILAILIGLFLSSIDFSSIGVKQLLSDKGIPHAFVALVTWGVYFTFIKIPIESIGWFWPAYLSWWGFAIVLVIMKIKSIKLEYIKEKRDLVYMISNGLLGTIALFAFNYALVNGQNSVVSPLSSSYPALFAIIAYFVFKDRLSKQQIAGIVITLAGVTSLSLVS